ncbi:hypothetical protein [Bosea caraganae]|nr:hypothetical protein [Bosea caraganae]
MSDAVRVQSETGSFGTPPRPANDPLGCHATQPHAQWLRSEAAGHIEQLLGELGSMARAAELRHLFYLLDMARQEAGTQAQRWQRG